MNDNDNIVCKNTYVNNDIVELPVYGDEYEPKIKEAFYLHIKHVDHHSQEDSSSDSSSNSSSNSSSEAEDGKFSINLLNNSTHG